MSKVEIYTIVILTLRLLIFGIYLGAGKDLVEPKSHEANAGYLLLGTIGLLPLIGRVFNWW